MIVRESKCFENKNPRRGRPRNAFEKWVDRQESNVVVCGVSDCVECRIVEINDTIAG